MAEVICVGMACTDVNAAGIDLDRTPNSWPVRVPADSLTLAGGGDALNESIVLSKLGHAVQLMVGCGEDGAGLLVRAIATQAGVDMSLCERLPEYRTPVSVVLIAEQAQRKFIGAKPGTPGSHVMPVRYVPEVEKINGMRVLSLASLFTPPLDDVALVARMVKRAKEQGALVCADVKPNHPTMTMEDYKDALPYIDYFFPNEEEAPRLAGGRTDMAEQAAYFRSLGIKHVLLKQGARGVKFYGEGEQFDFPAYRVKAVDSVGCGDNFAAGFISGLLQGLDHRGCCEFASATASICVETVGASTGVHSRAQVQARVHEGRNGLLPEH